MPCQDPTALDLHVWSFHVLHQFTNEVDVEMGQIISLVLGLGSNWASKPDSFPSSSPPGWALQHYPGYLTAPDSVDQDQFFFFYALGTSTSTPGSVLMYFSGMVQGPLSQVLQLVKCRTRSPVLVPQRPALLPTEGNKEQRRPSFPHQCHHMVSGMCGVFACSHTFTCALPTVSSLLSCTGKVQGLLFWVLRSVRGRISCPTLVIPGLVFQL